MQRAISTVLLRPALRSVRPNAKAICATRNFSLSLRLAASSEDPFEASSLPSAHDVASGREADQSHGKNIKSEIAATMGKAWDRHQKPSGARLYVGNLSFETNEDHLHEAFSKFGSVTDTYVMKNAATGQSRGFGFVTMSNGSEEAIAELNETELDGRTIRVDKSLEKDRSSPSSTSRAPGNRVYVGGLPFQSAEEDVRQLVEQYGEVKYLNFPLKDDGTSMGFAHVEFASSTSAQELLEAGDLEMDGRPLRVEVARERSTRPRQTEGFEGRPQRSSSRFGGGNDRYGGGGGERRYNDRREDRRSSDRPRRSFGGDRNERRERY